METMPRKTLASDPEIAHPAKLRQVHTRIARIVRPVCSRKADLYDHGISPEGNENPHFP
jgi:hypothetical protein